MEDKQKTKGKSKQGGGKKSKTSKLEDGAEDGEKTKEEKGKLDEGKGDERKEEVRRSDDTGRGAGNEVEGAKDEADTGVKDTKDSERSAGKEQDKTDNKDKKEQKELIQVWHYFLSQQGQKEQKELIHVWHYFLSLSLPVFVISIHPSVIIRVRHNYDFHILNVSDFYFNSFKYLIIRGSLKL